jgi:hypothetical protein
MKTEIKIQVRAYAVDLKDNRTGEITEEMIVLSKEMLQAAGLIGMTDEDLIYRIYNRKGYKVLNIGRPDKRELTVDLEELYNKQIRMERLLEFGRAHTNVLPDSRGGNTND